MNIHGLKQKKRELALNKKIIRAKLREVISKSRKARGGRRDELEFQCRVLERNLENMEAKRKRLTAEIKERKKERDKKK